LSIGDYVLSGGELGAAVILDTVTRLIPGALGNEASSKQESFTTQTERHATNGANSTCGSGGLLDYPHYTRPADFRGMVIPEVLTSGNHEEIRKWRRRTALEKTLTNRPELLDGAALSEEDKRMLAQITARKIQ
jgi:tRNA (guanine37-N1)-methyltransferase